MQTSHSTTSLTGLVIDMGDTPSCFICLEGVEHNKPLLHSRSLRTCTCIFHVHKKCWDAWMIGRDTTACPICKRDAVPDTHYESDAIYERQRQHVRIIMGLLLVFIFIASISILYLILNRNH